MDAKVAYGVWMCLIYSATPCIFSITGITMDQAAVACTKMVTLVCHLSARYSFNILYLMFKLLWTVFSCFSYNDLYLMFQL